MHSHKETLHHLTRVVLSFTFFLSILLLGTLLASNSLSSSWIPQQVLVFFGWILIICTILGMVLFTLDKD